MEHFVKTLLSFFTISLLLLLSLAGRTPWHQSAYPGRRVPPAQTFYPRMARCPQSPPVLDPATPTRRTSTTRTPPRRPQTARSSTPTSYDPDRPTPSRDFLVIMSAARRPGSTNAPALTAAPHRFYAARWWRRRRPPTGLTGPNPRGRSWRHRPKPAPPR